MATLEAPRKPRLPEPPVATPAPAPAPAAATPMPSPLRNPSMPAVPAVSAPPPPVPTTPAPPAAPANDIETRAPAIPPGGKPMPVKLPFTNRMRSPFNSASWPPKAPRVESEPSLQDILSPRSGKEFAEGVGREWRDFKEGAGKFGGEVADLGRDIGQGASAAAGKVAGAAGKVGGAISRLAGNLTGTPRGDAAQPKDTGLTNEATPPPEKQQAEQVKAKLGPEAIPSIEAALKAIPDDAPNAVGRRRNLKAVLEHLQPEGESLHDARRHIEAGGNVVAVSPSGQRTMIRDIRPDGSIVAQSGNLIAVDQQTKFELAPTEGKVDRNASLGIDEAQHDLAGGKPVVAVDNKGRRHGINSINEHGEGTTSDGLLVNLTGRGRSKYTLMAGAVEAPKGAKPGKTAEPNPLQAPPKYDEKDLRDAAKFLNVSAQGTPEAVQARIEAHQSGPALLSAIAARNNPEAADTDTEPKTKVEKPAEGKPSKPVFIDVRKAVDANPDDSMAAIDKIKAEIKAHQEAGGTALVHFDGKEIPVHMDARGIIRDPHENTVGLLALTQSMPGEKSGVELKPAEKPAPQLRTVQAEVEHSKEPSAKAAELTEKATGFQVPKDMPLVPEAWEKTIREANAASAFAAKQEERGNASDAVDAHFEAIEPLETLLQHLKSTFREATTFKKPGPQDDSREEAEHYSDLIAHYNDAIEAHKAAIAHYTDGELSEKSQLMGKPKGEAQLRTVESPAFNNWFGPVKNPKPGESSVVRSDYGEKGEHARGEPLTVYHGTARGGHTVFDPKKSSKDNLYGPAVGYFTEDPKIAESYKSKGAEEWQFKDKDVRAGFDKASNLLKQARDQGEITQEEYEDRKSKIGGSWLNTPMSQMANLMASVLPEKQRDQVIDRAPEAKPQQYAVHLNIRNPFDMNKRFTPEEARAVVDRAVDGLEPAKADSLRERIKEATEPMAGDVIDRNRTYSGDHLWNALAEATSKATANKILQRAGFDGLTHVGGERAGKGRVDPHRVWIPFHSEQIKEDQGENGRYDPNNPDIQHIFGFGRTQPPPNPKQPRAEEKFTPQEYAGRPFNPNENVPDPSGMSPHHKKVVGVLNSGLAGLHPDDAAKFKNDNHAIAARMTPEAAQHVSKGLRTARHFQTPEDVTSTYTKEFPDAQRKMREGDVLGGFYNPADRRMTLDGPAIANDHTGLHAQQIKGHEIGHAIAEGIRLKEAPNRIDMGGGHIPSGWQEAHDAEHTKGKLTNYAATKAQESFAESCAALLSGQLSPTDFRREFPKSAAVMEKHGILPKEAGSLRPESGPMKSPLSEALKDSPIAQNSPIVSPFNGAQARTVEPVDHDLSA